MTAMLALALLLALGSAAALNWSFYRQHGQASALPPLALSRPLQSLRLLFTNRRWLVGFGVGILGWILYVAALASGPLALVQAAAAGGIGILALLVWRGGAVRLTRREWIGVGISVGGLILLGVSLLGGGNGQHAARAGSWGSIALWLVVSAVLALLCSGPGRRLFAAGAGYGIGAGLLYAAGDVATKAAVSGGWHLLFVPAVLAAHGLAFAILQLGFQRGGALSTAGVSTLFTNALPIAAGMTLFHEPLPSGAPGVLRVLAFAAVVAAAALLTRSEPSATPTPSTGRAFPWLRWLAWGSLATALASAAAAVSLASAAGHGAGRASLPPVPRPAAARAGLLPRPFAQIGTGPDGGTVWQGLIANPAVAASRRPTVIYLPPGASARTRYPVLYLLQGFRGSPYQFSSGLRLAAVADRAIAAHAVRPFIAVAPPAGITARFNGEWTGVWETYLVRDVVPWTDLHLPVLPTRSGRVVAGLSGGGYGAVDIGLRRPGMFGTLESWSGSFTAPNDGSLAHANASERAAHDPSRLARREAPRLRALGTRFFLSAGTHDRVSAAATAAFARELGALRLPYRLVLGPGGHNGAFWRSQLPAALRYGLPPAA